MKVRVKRYENIDRSCAGGISFTPPMEFFCGREIDVVERDGGFQQKDGDNFYYWPREWVVVIEQPKPKNNYKEVLKDALKETVKEVFEELVTDALRESILEMADEIKELEGKQ